MGGLHVGSLRSGDPIWLDLGDFVQRHIYMWGTFEEQATRYVERHVRPSWTFLDVGSCEGYYAVLACSLGGPASRVVAIEPNPDVARQLRATVRLADYPIDVVETGCGAVPGSLPLTISDARGNIGMSAFARPERGSTSVDVPMTTLDEICRTKDLRPDVVKIDVEGFETQVLQGFADTLRDAPPWYLLVELAPKSNSHAEALGLLTSFGYSARRLLDDGTDAPLHSVDELDQVDLVVFERR
jgi:FkbM family methyltransferase